jgi:hypothetical protein
VGASDGIVTGIGSPRESGKMKIHETGHQPALTIIQSYFTEGREVYCNGRFNRFAGNTIVHSGPTKMMRRTIYKQSVISQHNNPKLINIHQISRTHNFQTIHSERFQVTKTHPQASAGTILSHES